MDEKIVRAKMAVGNLITACENQLKEAIEHEDWSRAAKLSSFITGLDQAAIIFEQSLSTEEK